MNVKDLLEFLSQIKDKSIPVALVGQFGDNPLATKSFVSEDRLIYQPHRLSIIID